VRAVQLLLTYHGFNPPESLRTFGS
jgi:hypothetical protein